LFHSRNSPQRKSACNPNLDVQQVEFAEFIRVLASDDKNRLVKVVLINRKLMFKSLQAVAVALDFYPYEAPRIHGKVRAHACGSERQFVRNNCRRTDALRSAQLVQNTNLQV